VVQGSHCVDLSRGLHIETECQETMITYRQLATAFARLELDPTKPVIAHASLSTLGQIAGGPETVLGAVLANSRGVMMPTFTYKTMVTPEVGPPNNGLVYGSNDDLNAMAQFYTPDMPADPLMGRAAEGLRNHPRAARSSHPILSFAGIHVQDALQAQSIAEPLAPIGVLAQDDGMVLLIGVDHTANTSLHYAEKLAGRKQFTRWALTQRGVVECPGFPGSSEGFQQAEAYLDEISRRVFVGNARVVALPLKPMLDIIQDLIENNPLALLPEESEDLRVQDARQAALA
jgi:aminoglycoside 3-N-acetyltransferase